MTRSPAETRGRILTAAIDCFQRYGFRKATVDDVARTAQVGKGTVYLHFADKDGLLIAAVELLSAELAQAAVKGQDPSRPMIDNLLLMLQNMIGFLRANPRLVSVTRDPAAFGAAPLMAVLAEQQRQGLGILEQVLRGGIARGDIAPVNVGVTVSVLVGAYQVFFFGQPGEAGFDRAGDFVAFMEQLLRHGIVAHEKPLSD